MERYSERLLNFEAQSDIGLRHRGELLSFDPSENLENSCSMGKGLKAVPPVGYVSYEHSANAAKVYSFGCELNFILYATGIPEPSDEECQEAHTLCPYAKNKLTKNMATLEDAIRVYKYNRSTRLLTGLNTVLYEYKRHGMEFKRKVMEVIVFGEHQQRLKHHDKIDFKKLKKTTANKLKDFYPLPACETFEKLYHRVKSDIGKIHGIGPLTIYDIALRIGFLYDEPLLPQDYVYIQAGALKGIIKLSSNPAYRSLFPARDWKAGAYPIADFTAAFGSLESMYIEDFLCVFHNELASLATYSVKDLQTKLLTYTNI